jgi:hypothetical protein
MGADFVFEVTLDIPQFLVEHILIPALQLTGNFTKEGLKSAGGGEYVLHRFVGRPYWTEETQGSQQASTLNGEIHLFVLNTLLTKRHNLERTMIPFVRSMGELPFVVNPNQLSKEELFDANSKVRSELGDDYDYNVPPHKIMHDIHVGRLQADERMSRQNFGMKQWFMVSTTRQMVS